MMKTIFCCLYFCVPLILFGQSSPVQSGLNTFIDPRDNEMYQIKTFTASVGYDVVINQTWMIENLRFNMYDESYFHEAVRTPNDHKKFGRLYSWRAALEACPKGWHLPTDLEWQRFIHMFARGLAGDGATAAYQDLIENGRSGFDALLGGYLVRLKGDQFMGFSESGSYWSAPTDNSNQTWSFQFNKYNTTMVRSSSDKNMAMSCRCIQD